MHEIDDTTESIATKVVDAVFQVHRVLGPGLLESTYELCLVHELKKRGIRGFRQVDLPVVYDDMQLDAGYRIDLLVEDCIVIELKSVEKILPIHEAQLLTYLKLSGHKLGFMINFNVPVIKNGMKRRVLTS